MITKDKVKVYNSFHGDIDGWARMGSKKEKVIMSDNDWSLIDNLLQDIRLVAKGLTSKEFSDTLQRKLIENCDNPETISQLKKMANKK
jgi:hypothetical protein